MIGLGTTLRCNLPPRHLWIVLSDPVETDGEILLVSLTTLRQGSADDACILGPEDYELLTHRTTVAYSRAKSGKIEGLERAVKSGEFALVTPVPRQTLRQIVEGARLSPELPRSKKTLLPANLEP